MTKQTNPLVSILIPTYMRAETVGRAIKSAQDQSYRNLEIIVYDNASNDETQRVVSRYSANDNRIKYFSNDRNIGPIANWEKCFIASSGEFIKFLWSDDYLDQSCVENLVTELANDPSAGFTLCSANLLNSNLDHQSTQYRNGVGHKFTFQEFVASMAIRIPHMPYTPAAALIRRKVVEKVFSQKNILDEECNRKAIGLDMHLIYRAFESYKYGLQTNGTVNIVSSADSISILERGILLNDCYFKATIALIQIVDPSYEGPFIMLRSLRSRFGGRKHKISKSLVNGRKNYVLKQRFKALTLMISIITKYIVWKLK